MKTIKYIAALILGICFVSCDDTYDINKDPDTNSTITPELSLPVVMFYAAQTNYDHAEYGMYLAQAFTTASKTQTNSLAYKGGWEFLSMNRHPQWRRHFYDIGANLNELLFVAEENKAYNYMLIGRTIRLMSTLFTTDMFGDMPLSEAYLSSAPKYDTQEDIYTWMIEEVNSLLADYNNPDIVNAPSNKIIPKSVDRIFEGNLVKWRQLTYGLKARLLLRKLPNWDNTPETCQQIIDAVDAAYTSDWEEANYYYDGGNGERNCPWGPYQPVINAWESRKNELDKAIVTKFFSKDILGVMDKPTIQKKADDPRLVKFMTARSGPSSDPSTKFRYLETNIGTDVGYKENHYPDIFTSIFNTNTSYVSLMLTEELLMIKAEALFWKAVKSGSKDFTEAHNVTKEAVRINMGRHGVTESNINAYFKLDGYLEEGASNFDIGRLMRQKYVCMYLQPEMWNDMRRYTYSNNTNKRTYNGTIIYPMLRRPYNLYEPYWMSNRDDNGNVKEEWVMRINYDPETEDKYNRKELERLGAYKNPEWLKKPMIWGLYNANNQ